MDQKWRVTSSKPLLSDRWINLRADRCLTASGAEIAPYYVLTYPDWVNVVAVTPDDSLVLVRQYRHAAGEFILELPGGTVDGSGSDAELTARRELEEETGYVAGRWQLVSVLYANPATQTNRVHIFLARDAHCVKPQSLDPGEEGLTVRVVPIPQVLDGLSAGLLGMSMHVSSVLLGLAAAGRLQLKDCNTKSPVGGSII
jgi:8-oxo-dGTP pyrophosphatase MutT (NUDIX family)